MLEELSSTERFSYCTVTRARLDLFEWKKFIVVIIECNIGALKSRAELAVNHRDRYILRSYYRNRAKKMMEVLLKKAKKLKNRIRQLMKDWVLYLGENLSWKLSRTNWNSSEINRDYFLIWNRLVFITCNIDTIEILTDVFFCTHSSHAVTCMIRQQHSDKSYQVTP